MVMINSVNLIMMKGDIGKMEETNKDIPVLNAAIVLSMCWQMISLFIEMHSHMFDYKSFAKSMETKKEILITTGNKKEEVDLVVNQLVDFLKLVKENDEERKLKNERSSK